MMFIPSLKMIFQYISHIFHIVSPVFQLFFGFLTHPHPGFLIELSMTEAPLRWTGTVNWTRPVFDFGAAGSDAKMLFEVEMSFSDLFHRIG
jgi:hypothetical protein